MREALQRCGFLRALDSYRSELLDLDPRLEEQDLPQVRRLESMVQDQFPQLRNYYSNFIVQFKD